MSLLSWFSKKTPPKADLGAQRAGLPASDANAAQRKNERLALREQLYSVVRECMMRAGVLSASYKFKVLSLDPRGLQYLVMMDLVQRAASEAARMAEIEAQIIQYAQARHNMVVTAVYWRINDPVSAASPPPSSASPAARQQALPRNTGGASLAPEPLHDEEVLAFKNALAKATTATTDTAPVLAGSGQIVRTHPRKPAPEPDFKDTEMTPDAHPDERASPLSGTQYGALE